MADDRRMKKSRAIKLLGGSNAAAAKALSISRQAVFKWPDPLPRRIESRVLSALGSITTARTGRKQA